MEFTVLDAFNVPPKPVLAVHTGTVRRQVKLEVNQPFTVPDPGSKSAAVEVSVFQQLASQLLPDEGKAETTCAVPVRRPDGTASQVKLRIKRGNGDTATAGNGVSPEEDSLAFTKDYLDSHHLQQRVQGLIQDVLREQPLDPYRYMLNQLRKVQAGEEALPEIPKKEGDALAESKEKEPLVPKPPEQPKTGRPAPNTCRTTKAGLDTKAWTTSSFIVRHVLESKPCRSVGEASVKEAFALQASKGLSTTIVDRARERAVKKALSGSTPKEQAKVLIRSCVRTAALYLSKEYNRALTKWSVSCLMCGAVQVIGQKSEYADTCLLSTPEAVPEPTPFVFLNTKASWAEWLSPASSNASTPSHRSITPHMGTNH